MTFFRIFVIILLFSTKIKAQNTYVEDGKAVSFLKEFYTSYAKVLSIQLGKIPYVDFNQKLDSLAAKYSTPKLRKEAKEWWADGQLLYTNTADIDSVSLKTLQIKKDIQKKNTYIVSYVYVHDTSIYSVPPPEPIKQKVILHVTIGKIGKEYKIVSVK